VQKQSAAIPLALVNKPYRGLKDDEDEQHLPKSTESPCEPVPLFRRMLLVFGESSQ
jgi:hypothetical protein